MQKIDYFIGQKILSMKNIVGGKRVEKTYYASNSELILTDKYFYEDDCDQPYKVITGIGSGRRAVHTYPACHHKSDHND